MMPGRSIRQPAVAPSSNGYARVEEGEDSVWAVLSRRRWTIVLIALLVFAVAMVLTMRQTRLYTSTAAVLVDPTNTGSTTTPPNMATEKQVAESAAVAVLAAKAVHSTDSLLALTRDLTVGVPLDTEILNFSYLDASPRVAQTRAEAFAKAYLEFRAQDAASQLKASTQSIDDRIQTLSDQLGQLYDQEAAARTEAERARIRAEETSVISQIGILQQKMSDLTPAQGTQPGSIVQDAELPLSPSRPNVPINAFLAIFVGVLLGVGGALAREYTDDRVRNAKILEGLLRTPVFATLSPVRMSDSPSMNLVVESDPESNAAERFRQLRTNLMFASMQNRASTILITSAREGEGKTFVAANLAVALAKAGKRVILVSADLRRPRIERMFQSPSSPGLVDVLLQQASWDQVAQRADAPNLLLIPSGSRPSNPPELLGSGDMVDLLDELRQTADYVLIDACPLLPVTDAAVLVPACDGVLFVASAKKATRKNIVHAQEQLATLDANILGAALLDAPEEEVGTQYGPAYGETEERPVRRFRLLTRGGR
ncbi:MAG TPA: polysaccharide biosynthesis tyrosine autokinase [Actinomycetota bacterium]|nr:polysaccharide biosynthesis tyrosine autokinase [Actinomycetota bacterium]